MAVVSCGDEPPYSDPYCGNGYPDPYEECDAPGTPGCTADCTLEKIELIAHWSFETLNGDSKMPCLPGDPDVQVHIQSSIPGFGADVSSPCATGQTPVLVKPGVLFDVWVTSGADRQYTSSRFVGRPAVGSRDLPTVVTYTDAGYVQAAAYYADAEDRHWCTPPGVETVRFVVDGATDRAFLCNGYNEIGPFSEGTHSLRADGFDSAMNVVATSSSIDVEILAGAIGDVVTVKFVP